MADHSGTFLLVTILVLIAIVMIAGMKYFAASRLARLHGANAGDLTADLAEIKLRLAAIEKVLKEVE